MNDEKRTADEMLLVRDGEILTDDPFMRQLAEVMIEQSLATLEEGADVSNGYEITLRRVYSPEQHTKDNSVEIPREVVRLTRHTDLHTAGCAIQIYADITEQWQQGKLSDDEDITFEKIREIVRECDDIMTDKDIHDSIAALLTTDYFVIDHTDDDGTEHYSITVYDTEDEDSQSAESDGD